MRFIVHGGILARSMNAISSLSAKNNTIPIVENFLFELKENTLTITATDLETVASVKIELQEAEEQDVNRVCVPAKEFLTLINQLTAIPLTVIVNKDCSIDIMTSDGRYNFNGLEADDFPKMIQVDNPVSFNINSSSLVNAINKTIFAVAQDDYRPQMAGVLFEFSEKGLTFVGTDSHKLVRFRNKKFATQDERSFILPKKALNMIQRILSSINEDLDVRIENNDSNIAFYFDNYHIACRLIEGKYPKYEAAIPQDNPNKLVVSSALLKNSIKRVQIFANPATFQIRLSLSEKRMSIVAEDANFGRKGKEEMACDYQGEEMEIGLNAKYLIDMLNNIETENICFELSRPERPCIILPCEENTEEEQDESLLMLVMPVLLSE